MTITRWRHVRAGTIHIYIKEERESQFLCGKKKSKAYLPTRIKLGTCELCTNSLNSYIKNNRKK